MPPALRSSARLGRALAALLGLAGCAPEPPAPAAAPPRARPAPLDEARAFFIGHSLIGFTIPTMSAQIAESLGARLRWDAQIRSGAGLKVNWSESALAEGRDARVALVEGGYDVVVMTEAVKLADMIRWMEPARYGGYFYDLARAGSPEGRVLFYTTWHRRDEQRRTFGFPRRGDLLSHIEEDRPRWEGIVDAILEERPGAAMPILPGGEALARLVRAARAGEVPGLAGEDALFDDEIHLSPTGSYFMALVFFGAIFRQSPVGASATVEDHEGRGLTLAPETARALQRVAWDALRAYPRSELWGVARQ